MGGAWYFKLKPPTSKCHRLIPQLSHKKQESYSILCYATFCLLPKLSHLYEVLLTDVWTASIRSHPSWNHHLAICKGPLSKISHWFLNIPLMDKSAIILPYINPIKSHVMSHPILCCSRHQARHGLVLLIALEQAGCNGIHGIFGVPVKVGWKAEFWESQIQYNTIFGLVWRDFCRKPYWIFHELWGLLSIFPSHM